MRGVHGGTSSISKRFHTSIYAFSSVLSWLFDLWILSDVSRRENILARSEDAADSPAFVMSLDQAAQPGDLEAREEDINGLIGRGKLVVPT